MRATKGSEVLHRQLLQPPLPPRSAFLNIQRIDRGGEGALGPACVRVLGSPPSLRGGEKCNSCTNKTVSLCNFFLR